MTVQPQPPQPPHIPDPLKMELDRQYTRTTDYIDLRVEKVLVETRLARNESRLRDEDLRQRVENLEVRVANVEATQAVIIDLQRQTIAALQALTQRVEALEHRADAMEQFMRAMAEQIRDGFAAQGERLGELAVRMDRLERGGDPPPEPPAEK